MSRNLLVATNPARRKMSAKQRAAALRNLKKARAARKRPRRRNPSRAAAPVSNPRRKRRKARRRAVRRNPIRLARFSPKRVLEGTVMPALVGGAGAVANDMAYGFALNLIPAGTGGTIVEQFRTGYLRHVGKVASALLLSYVAGMVLPRRVADQLGAGAVTVVGYNAVRDVLTQVAPTLNLGAYIAPELGYAGAGRSAPGYLDPRGRAGGRAGLAAYITPRLRGLSQVRQLSIRGQLRQPNPFTPRGAATETYSENAGT